MNVFLMHEEQPLERPGHLPANQNDLIQDLELETLLEAMARGDELIFDVAREVLLSASDDVEVALYRQAVLRDCLENRSVVQEMYQVASDAIQGERKIILGLFSRSPSAVLHRSIEVLEMLVTMLGKLRQLAVASEGLFKSAGFTRLLTMLEDELGPEYFAEVEGHLKELRFRDGVAMSVVLGAGNRGSGYVLRRAAEAKQSWVQRVTGKASPRYTLAIADRDESGARALGELRDLGIAIVADALGRSTDHILGFFETLRAELAFYVGCVNLEEALAAKAGPICFPAVFPTGERRYSCRGLYDPCLALRVDGRLVGNDVVGDGKDLVMVTGANQGGKSTFLRSVGVAQLMMQAGMFVPAEELSAEMCKGLFTHYRREEDRAMASGKLDEELARMSGIVDDLRAGCMVLLNESFAATNEREGSEVAFQIVSALVDSGVKVVFVTHLYEVARRFYDEESEAFLFLRAERLASGVRTFKVKEGAPLQTSYGEDLYRRLFSDGHLSGSAWHARGGGPLEAASGTYPRV